jgi:hypothetical protein
MRLAILLLAALPIVAVNLGAAEEMSGRWTFEGDVQGNQVNLSCTLAQSADTKLAGKCEVNGMEMTEIAGDVKDAEFRFSFTVAGYTLAYIGKVQGDAVGGDIEVAGVTGKFTGQRVKE